MKALIDSSVWIDFIRQGEARHPDVATAIRTGRAFLCEPVWVELWSGVRSKREEVVLAHLRGCCTWLEIDTETWRMTAELRRVARRNGLNCPLADVLIVACAKRYGVSLIHRDKHLDALMKLP